MKIFIGWFLLIACSFLSIVGVVTIISIINDSANNPDFAIHKSWYIIPIIVFIILIILFLYGFRYGLKLIKRKKTIEHFEYNEVLNINISGHIKYEDYRNLIFEITYKRPLYVYIHIIIILKLLSNIFQRGSIFDNLEGFDFMLIGILILLPIIIHLQTKKLYSTNSIFQGVLNYNINNDSIQITGRTMNTNVSWDHFYRAKETKNFYLLYSGESIAILIDKRLFSEHELTEFRKFIKSLE